MDTDSLARLVGELLQEHGLTLAVAESCTGGLLGTHITNIPGSSAYFEGGVIAYSYGAKEHVLGVPASTLKEHGAVSAETAIAMASGVRQVLQTDFALAITCIAGPAGATPTKPVGLAYVGLASATGETCKRYQWLGDRWENREWAAKAALALLHEHLCALRTSAGGDTSSEGNTDPAPSQEDKCTPCTPIEVEARFSPSGRPDPMAFKWQGRWLTVAFVGRTWNSGEGDEAVQHSLVITPLDGVFELSYQPATAQWRLVRGRGRQTIV
jgi:PncC family amidohydrolase